MSVETCCTDMWLVHLHTFPVRPAAALEEYWGGRVLLLHRGVATRNSITTWQERGRPDGRPRSTPGFVLQAPSSPCLISQHEQNEQGPQVGTWGTFSEKNLTSYFPFNIFFLKSQFGWLKTAVKSLVFFCTYFLQEQFQVRWRRKKGGIGFFSVFFLFVNRIRPPKKAKIFKKLQKTKNPFNLHDTGSKPLVKVDVY